MRSIRFLPLAFIAGQHGFLIFAPYAAFALTLYHVTRRPRRKPLIG